MLRKRNIYFSNAHGIYENSMHLPPNVVCPYKHLNMVLHRKSTVYVCTTLQSKLKIKKVVQFALFFNISLIRMVIWSGGILYFVKLVSTVNKKCFHRTSLIKKKFKQII